MSRVILYLQPLLYLCFLTGGVIFGLHQGTSVISDNKPNEEVWWATLLRSINLVCIVHFIPVCLGFLYPHKKLKDYREKLKETKGKLPNIFIRYVTRGDKSDIITESVLDTLNKTKDYPNINIEVVTDEAVIYQPVIQELNPTNLQEFVVPKDYSTKANTLFKARALQYILENSPAKSEDYILHLDEESHITEDSILGMYQHIYKNPDRIGQGAITYKRSLHGGLKNWVRSICSMADSIRIADDMSRFRLSFNIGNPYFGCKGSYILIKNQIEKDVGFNFAPELCITEDASFAFNAYDKKYKFAYVEGMIEEISPSTFNDFIEQRARWMRGLWLLVLYHPCNMFRRVMIAFGMLTWSLIILNVVALISFFVLHDYLLPTSIAVLNGLIFASYLFSYGYGSLVGGYGFLSIVSIILTPIFLIMETVAAVYAICTIKHHHNFHVIYK